MSRTVRIGRATYLEEDKPGGGVTRTLISGSADIIRPGDVPTLVGAPAVRRPLVARSVSARAHQRDTVELREKAPAAFTLRLDWRVRKDIKDELSFVRHRLDPDREAGGWLFAHSRAGDRAYEQDICRAVTAGTTGHGRTTLRLSNPIETWWATGTPH